MLLRLALMACVALSGCQSFPDALTGAPRVAADTNDIQQVDLAQEIRAETPTKVAANKKCTTTEYSAATQPEPAGPGGQTIVASPNAQRCLRRVTKAFYADPVDLRARRNRVQARLLAASASACGKFEERLNYIQANTNMVAGIATTAAAGAGAIVTNEVTARILSGVGAVIAGSRAEFNADFFYREAVPVVVKAINASRRNFRRNIIALHRAEGITDYTLWDAIADAFRYNQKCSLVAGLSHLETAVTLAENPGLDTLNRALIQSGISRQIIHGSITTYGQVLARNAAPPSAIRANMIDTRTSVLVVADQYRTDANALVEAQEALGAALQEQAKILPKQASIPSLNKLISTIRTAGLASCQMPIVIATNDLAEAQANRAVAFRPLPGEDLNVANASATLTRLSSQLDAFMRVALRTIGDATAWVQNQRVGTPITSADFESNVSAPIKSMATAVACTTS
jgi:hypothetical protein